MNIDERIERRRRDNAAARLIRDYDALSPVAHVSEPTGRGPVLEETLDHLDPAFDGHLPPDGYVWGPKGAGKSAVLTALFDRLRTRSRRSRSVIHTATRADVQPDTAFVYVDARRAGTDFAFYRTILDAMVDDPVPSQGIGTEQVRERLASHLGYDRHAVVAVDHVGEPETYDLGAVGDLFEAVNGPVSWLAVGRTPPAATPAGAAPDDTVAVPAYERHALVDVLTDRTTTGLSRHAVAHEDVRAIAEWADGDAHDALAAVFGAADVALEAQRDVVAPADVEAGIDGVPPECVSLGRVLSLSVSRRRVLRELVALTPAQRDSVADATEAIAAADGVELSATTVKRLLYELAEQDVIRRVSSQNDSGQGRPPSRLEPRFPTRVFVRLCALTADE